MLRGAALAAVALAAAGCGIRAPSRIDRAALVAKHGAVEARRTLELRVLRSPGDVAARLALAALDEDLGRPSAAIEQLEAVEAIGGPIGTRWHAEDRARLARLLAARGTARLVRESPAALADLLRARRLGATVDERGVASAKRARAIAQLRHVDAKERAAGHLLLRELARSPVAEPAWAISTPAERGTYGAWLWRVGARRAAWEYLAAWHAATAAPRDPALQAAYLVALAWWSPHDAPPPPAEDLVGPERCRFGPAARCDARAILDEPAALPGLLAAPSPPTANPLQASAWLSLTLAQALRGEASWGAALASRVDLAALPVSSLPPPSRAAFARLAGRDAAGLDPATSGNLLAAAGRALEGAPAAELRAALGALADTDEGRALLRVVEVPAAPAAPPAAPASAVSAAAAAAAGYARARVPAGPPATALAPLATAYARDPAIADRLALDVIATAPDAAPAHASLGALFEALADPARSRAAWQAAVDASPEPAFLRGLAEAAARARDPDAALVLATTAAAASGDPAVVWIAIARTLDGVGAHVHALEAARGAIELAGRDAIADALDAAISASLALGRTAQAAALSARRATVAPPPPPPPPRDNPTDAAAALAAHRAHPTAGTADRLWVASRWNPRSVALRAALLAALAPDDPRRRLLSTELLALAADPDASLGRAAVAALR